MNKMRILIMAAKPYSVKDDKSGETKDGITVEYYFFPQDDSLISQHYDFTNGAGYKRAKASLPIDCGRQFSVVPGIYDGDFMMSIGADGKPKLALSNVSALDDTIQISVSNVKK